MPILGPILFFLSDFVLSFYLYLCFFGKIVPVHIKTNRYKLVLPSGGPSGKYTKY